MNNNDQFLAANGKYVGKKKKWKEKAAVLIALQAHDAYLPPGTTVLIRYFA